MKIILYTLFLTVFADAGEKIPTIVFEKTTYKNVVIKKNIDGVSLIHETGIKRIDYKKLTPELLKLVGPFDKHAAEKAKAVSLANEERNDKNIIVEPVKKVEQKPTLPAKVAEVKKSPFKPTTVEAAKDIQKSGNLNGAKLK